MDIKIEYIGLRPGEKLYEEKLMAEEGLRKTDNDLIHIGCPIPFDVDIFLSQLDRLDLAGKTLFPVMTHEGSGLGTAAKTLKKACRKATVGKGLAVRGSDAKDSRELVTDWARCSVAWHE